MIFFHLPEQMYLHVEPGSTADVWEAPSGFFFFFFFNNSSKVKLHCGNSIILYCNFFLWYYHLWILLRLFLCMFYYVYNCVLWEDPRKNSHTPTTGLWLIGILINNPNPNKQMWTMLLDRSTWNCCRARAASSTQQFALIVVDKYFRTGFRNMTMDFLGW